MGSHASRNKWRQGPKIIASKSLVNKKKEKEKENENVQEYYILVHTLC